MDPTKREKYVPEDVTTSMNVGLAGQGLLAAGLFARGLPWLVPSAAAPIMADKLNPKSIKQQAKMDSNYLRYSRARDSMERPYSFKQSDTRNAEETVRVLQKLTELMNSNYVASVPGGEKTSSGVQKISSPLEKASVRLNPAQIQQALAIEEANKALRSQKGGGAVADALKYRPQWLGGPSTTERTMMRAGDFLKGLLGREEIVTNQFGNVIGSNRRFLGGPLGMAVKLPAALLALHGLNKAFVAREKSKQQGREGKNFKAAFGVVTNNDMFLNSDAGRAYQDYPEEFTRAAQEGFHILNKYAPSVAADPKLAAEYLSRLARDVHMEATGEEYLNTVQDALKLEEQMQRVEPDLIRSAGTLAGRVID